MSTDDAASIFSAVAYVVCVLLATSGIGFMKKLLKTATEPEHPEDFWEECYEPRILGRPRMPFWWKPDQLRGWK